MRLGYRLGFLEVVEGEPFPPQVVEVVEVEVFRRRSFLEVVEVVVEGEPFPPQEVVEVVEVVVEGEPFPPQVVEVVEVVEAEEVLLRLLDLMEEVSVQSFFTPN